MRHPRKRDLTVGRSLVGARMGIASSSCTLPNSKRRLPKAPLGHCGRIISRVSRRASWAEGPWREDCQASPSYGAVYRVWAATHWLAVKNCGLRFLLYRHFLRAALGHLGFFSNGLDLAGYKPSCIQDAKILNTENPALRKRFR